MEQPIVLIPKVGVPEKREVGRVAGCKKMDVWGCGELGEESGGRGTSEGRRIEGVDDEVERFFRRRGVEFMEDCVEHFSGLGAEFRQRRQWAVVDDCGDGREDLADCEVGGVAVCYDDPGWGQGLLNVDVLGEGVCKMAFAPVAVETDAEGLGELETPLGEGAGVERVEIGVGRLVGVFVGFNLLVVLLVG